MRRCYSNRQQNNNVHRFHVIATEQLRTSLRPHSHALPLIFTDCLSARTVLYVYHLSVASRTLIPTSSSLRPRGMYVSWPPLRLWKESSASTNLGQPLARGFRPSKVAVHPREIRRYKEVQQCRKLVVTRSVVHATVLLKSGMWWR